MYYESIEDMVGNTPILKLNRLFKKNDVYAKLEYFNPTFSIKDRAAFKMVEEAVKKGQVKDGDYIIEATSGNTGIGMCVAANYYKLHPICVVFSDVSDEKINLLKAYGATVIVCDATISSYDVGGYVWVAKYLSNTLPDLFWLNQFSNLDNSSAHYFSTGPELIQQMDGKIDYVFSTIGTGGTISGIAKYIKEINPNIGIIGVEPRGGIYKDYFNNSYSNYIDHRIHSISDNFISDNFHKHLVDDIIQVHDEEAFQFCYKALKTEGICIGTSSGCVLAGIENAILSNNYNLESKNIVTILPDLGLKYGSTLFNNDYLEKEDIKIDRIYRSEIEERISYILQKNEGVNIKLK